MRGWLRNWGPAVAWSAVILLLTSVRLPGAVWRAAPAGTDKIVHGVVYGVLGWLSARGLVRSRGDRPGAILGALVAAFLFAALDEAHQAWLPGRQPALADWLADVAGVSAGLGGGILRGRRAAESREEEEADA